MIKRHVIRVRKPTEDHYPSRVNMPSRGDRTVVRAAAIEDVHLKHGTGEGGRRHEDRLIAAPSPAVLGGVAFKLGQVRDRAYEVFCRSEPDHRRGVCQEINPSVPMA